MDNAQSRTLVGHLLGTLYGASSVGATFHALRSDGLWLWGLLLVAAIGLLLFGRYLFELFAAKLLTTWSNIATLMISTAFTLLVAEGGIKAAEWIAANQAQQDDASLTGPLLQPNALSLEARAAMADRLGVLVLPDAWRRAPLAEPPRSYLWHGVLHEKDTNAFRRSEPLPPKRADVYRVVVVGDSLTYGVGVAKEHTYAAVLQRLLDPQYRLEVLNLGVSGNQSQDTLNLLRRQLPALQPDLVIYGVCLNDFLPSRVGEYTANVDSGGLRALGNRLADQTRVGSFVADRYKQYLLQQGHRVDFMDDILADFDGYQTRFAQDVAAMAALVQNEHGVPFVSMVLHQYLNVGGRADRVAQAAERHLQHAGIQVVPSASYFAAYDQRNLPVSRWEGHPNELAHALYASLLLPHVEAVPGISAYRRQLQAQRSEKQIAE